MQAESADSSTDLLRHEPIGEDSKGNLYYYFSFNNEDCRLYKQEPPYRKTNKRRRSSGDEDTWETITTSVEEISDFLETLSASRSVSCTLTTMALMMVCKVCHCGSAKLLGRDMFTLVHYLQEWQGQVTP